VFLGHGRRVLLLPERGLGGVHGDFERGLRLGLDGAERRRGGRWRARRSRFIEFIESIA
jgi:hypothetical protein